MDIYSSFIITIYVHVSITRELSISNQREPRLSGSAEAILNSTPSLIYIDESNKTP